MLLPWWKKDMVNCQGKDTVSALKEKIWSLPKSVKKRYNCCLREEKVQLLREGKVQPLRERKVQLLKERKVQLLPQEGKSTIIEKGKGIITKRGKDTVAASRREKYRLLSWWIKDTCLDFVKNCFQPAPVIPTVVPITFKICRNFVSLPNSSFWHFFYTASSASNISGYTIFSVFLPLCLKSNTVILKTLVTQDNAMYNCPWQKTGRQRFKPTVLSDWP